MFFPIPGQPNFHPDLVVGVTDRKRRMAEIQRLNAGLSEQVAERTRELAEKVEQLARANAELHKLDQTRNEFVSLVSHQIRAPLTNVRGAVERMGTDCTAINPTCHRMFAVINEQTQRLDHLVRDVLNAERLEAGRVREVHGCRDLCTHRGTRAHRSILRDSGRPQMASPAGYDQR